MRIDNLFKIGDEILEKVDKALSTHDYEGLGTELRKVVSGTTSTVVKSGVGAVSSVIRQARSAISYKPPYFTKDVNKGLGIINIICGAAILAFCFLMLGILSIPMMLGGLTARAIPGLVVLFFSALLGAGVLYSGVSIHTLAKRFYEYGAVVGEKSYILIKEISDKTGRSVSQVTADLKRMKIKGFLPTATFDRDSTTLMLTDEVYLEYARSVRASQEQSLKEGISTPKKSDTMKAASQKSFYKIDDSLPEDVKAILKDGNDYLNSIRDYNDMIPDDEPMSDKLYTLEATVLSIFKKVQKQPETAGDLRKFMSYYLPTTEKLVKSYVKLSKEDDTIENVSKSRREIEDAMDVINEAFVKLLNQLFLDDAWDISSDISVMKTMMKQDALL